LFISPLRKIEYAKSIVGIENYVEVYVAAPLATLTYIGDSRGLYEKHTKRRIKDFTGLIAL
jgi:adenylylsulfate kinase-like enzyme